MNAIEQLTVLAGIQEVVGDDLHRVLAAALRECAHRRRYVADLNGEGWFEGMQRLHAATDSALTVLRGGAQT